MSHPAEIQGGWDPLQHGKVSFMRREVEAPPQRSREGGALCRFMLCNLAVGKRQPPGVRREGRAHAALAQVGLLDLRLWGEGVCRKG
jgi:hypothetical protein